VLLVLAGLALPGITVQAQRVPERPLPEIHALMREVQQHQRRLDKVRESYTYTSTQTLETLDGSGRVTKSETTESEDFFVNGHVIERLVKKNGQPLDAKAQQKEAGRVTKQVEKAESTPPGQPLQGPKVDVSHLLELMDVRNERRESFRGRPTIVFDFAGRKDARTHGVVEDASKKLEGTLWVDEADRQVAQISVRFHQNFHVAGGLLANVEKGTRFRFEQAPVPLEAGRGPGARQEAEPALWLPTGAEATVQMRLLLLKNVRQHFVERDGDYKRFRVAAEESHRGSGAVE